MAIEEIVHLLSSQFGTIELRFDWNTSDCMYIVPCILAISLLPNCSFYIRDIIGTNELKFVTSVLSIGRDGKLDLKTLHENQSKVEGGDILYR